MVSGDSFFFKKTLTKNSPQFWEKLKEMGKKQKKTCIRWVQIFLVENCKFVEKNRF